MPNRIIKESIKTSAEIDALSWFEEVFFYRLLVSCDDYGRYDGNPVILKNTLFPTKENVTAAAIEGVTNRLQELGLLYCYTVCGKAILQIATWFAHQQPRAVKSKYPDPPPEIADRLPQKGKRKRLNEDESTCKQMISNDFNGNQEKSTESKCTRNRIRIRERNPFSIDENVIEGSATRAHDLPDVDNHDNWDNEPIRIVPGKTMQERGIAVCT